MPRPDGGYIAKYTAPSVPRALGVWSIRDYTSAIEAGTWPVAGLLLHLDASDASTLYDATSGGSLVAADGAVARWEDKSGNGNHVTQSTSNNRPVRKTAIQAARDILRFDGSNDCLSGSGPQWANAAFSVFVVCARTTLSGTFPAIVCEQSSTTNGYLSLGMNQGGANGNSEVAIHRTGQATSASNLLPTAARMRVIDYVSDGISSGSATVSVRMDGVAASSALTLSSLSTNASLGICASKGGTADFFNGDVGEILLYSRKLTSLEVSLVEKYLGNKWGIALA